MNYVAFLRAINVGGRRIAMADLVKHFRDLGVEDVTTYIASGNVCFTSELDARELEQRIAKHLEDRLGYDVPTIVRTAGEVHAICSSDVFAEHAKEPAHKLYVSFVLDRLELAHHEKLTALGNDVDSFARVHRDIFWLRNVDAGESMNNSDVEKALKIVATRRTINTVRKIDAMLSR